MDKGWIYIIAKYLLYPVVSLLYCLTSSVSLPSILRSDLANNPDGRNIELLLEKSKSLAQENREKSPSRESEGEQHSLLFETDTLTCHFQVHRCTDKRYAIHGKKYFQTVCNLFNILTYFKLFITLSNIFIIASFCEIAFFYCFY